ncbi:MAG: ester cyclase [Flavobacteriaceae bacterium]
MEDLKKNRELIVRYFNAITGVDKTDELLSEYTNDKKLIDHIKFFDGAFPQYELFIEEMIAEGNKVLVRGRCTGIHKNEFNGIPPTHRSMDLPFVIRYTIENNLITDHWLIADQVILMEQLGLMDKKSNQSA